MSGKREAGQAALELSVVLPIALALLIGLVDMGRVVWANDAISNAAAEAARFAIVRGGASSNPCPVGPPSGSAIVPAPSVSCPHPSPSKQAILDRARERAWAVGGTVRAQACYGMGCRGDQDIPGATNARGTSVTVTVTADLSLVSTAFLGAIVGRHTFTLSASSTMPVNH
jgi:hypothetical protein